MAPYDDRSFLYVRIQTDHNILSVDHTLRNHIAMGGRDDQRFPGCTRCRFLQFDADDELTVFDLDVHSLCLSAVVVMHQDTHEGLTMSSAADGTRFQALRESQELLLLRSKTSRHVDSGRQSGSARFVLDIFLVLHGWFFISPDTLGV